MHFSELLTHTHARTRARVRARTFKSPFPGTTRVSRYQKRKTNLDFTETVSGSGISWAICKSAPRSRQITDNHASNPPISFLQARCPSCRPVSERVNQQQNQLGMPPPEQACIYTVTDAQTDGQAKNVALCPIYWMGKGIKH